MKLENFSHLAQVIACVGVVPAIWGLFDSARQAQEEEQKTQALLRLTAFPALDGVIQRDRELRDKVSEATAGLENLTRTNQLRQNYPTGRAAYLGIPGLADAGRHYEYLGVMIRLGYVEFRPIFEVVSFPDDLWAAAESSGLLRMIREENWNGPGQSMSDFWRNFEYLRTCYQLARQGKPVPVEPAMAKPSPAGGFLERLIAKPVPSPATENRPN